MHQRNDGRSRRGQRGRSFFVTFEGEAAIFRVSMESSLCFPSGAK